MYLTLANLTLDIPEDVTLEELTAVCTMLSARQAELRESQRREQYRQLRSWGLPDDAARTASKGRV